MKDAFILMMLCWFCTGCNQQDTLMKIEGEAQGTTYHITCISSEKNNLKAGIDSILSRIDSSLSTYVSSSVISRINRNDSNVVADQYFKDVFLLAMQIAEETNGIFDPTVAPLVNAYGFGASKKTKVDSSVIDSLKQYTGFRKVQLKEGKIVKETPQAQLDFNAIAQGYSVDILAAYLELQGIQNYLVELGGELKAKGKKFNEDWKVGIDKPTDSIGTTHQLQAIVTLQNKALCTSGNYRKFYMEDGKKYAHIIDPRSGYPAKQNILSSSVIAENCAVADAYATAFMVMGLDAAKSFLANHKSRGLEVYFIYEEDGQWKTYTSQGLQQLITDVPQ